MNEAYRETPPPTREEFAALEERLSALERRKPKEPFVLALWHTLTAGLVVTAGTIYAIGWLYDNMASGGTKLSLYITLGLVFTVAIFTAICSLAGLEDRRGLRSPWRTNEPEKKR